MLKKLVNCLILGSLFTSSAFAGDFLAKVSNGALSDNSQGVKALNLDEMKQVKGGYQVLTSKLGNSEYIALAIPDNTTTYKQLVAIYTVTGDNTLYQARENLMFFLTMVLHYLIDKRGCIELIRVRF